MWRCIRIHSGGRPAASPSVLTASALPPPPATSSRPPPLRLLCLHGFTENATLFRDRTGSLRRALHGVAEFTFPDAPNNATAFPAAYAAHCDTEPRGWWTSEESADDDGDDADDAPVAPVVPRSTTGWKASLAHLRATVARQGPFDGVLGFSQGAAAAALLLAAEPRAFRCALLVAGYVPLDPTLAAALHALPPLPHASLLVSGQADELVPRVRCEQLASCFAAGGVTWFNHGGGHRLPNSALFHGVAREFFEAARS